MSHELSVTVKRGNRWYNVSSKTSEVLGAPDYQQGFATRQEAEKAARRRSKSFKRVQTMANVEDAGAMRRKKIILDLLERGGN